MGGGVYLKNYPGQLVCYKRYIDDFIMAWEGDMPSLKVFLAGLNDNVKNISLSRNVDTMRMTFLDLKIFKDGVHFRTHNYFKPTDRNGYIPLNSFHQNTWLCNIPRGQFFLLRRNCALDSDYQDQSLVLAKKFLQKGYVSEQVYSEREWIGCLERKTLVADSNRGKRDYKQDFKMILDYNAI